MVEVRQRGQGVRGAGHGIRDVVALVTAASRAFEVWARRPRCGAGRDCGGAAFEVRWRPRCGGEIRGGLGGGGFGYSSCDSALIVAGQQLFTALGRPDFGANNWAKKNGSELPPHLPIVPSKVGRAFPIRF